MVALNNPAINNEMCSIASDLIDLPKNCSFIYLLRFSLKKSELF